MTDLSTIINIDTALGIYVKTKRGPSARGNQFYTPERIPHRLDRRLQQLRQLRFLARHIYLPQATF